MKKIMTFLSAGVLMITLCTGLAACNEPKDPDRQPGLGEEIPGVETQKVTGTFIGSYSNTGFGSLILQVDEVFPIGQTFEYDSAVYRTPNQIFLPETGTYHNLIQVQCNLPVEEKRVSVSIREFREEKDRVLFVRGSGIVQALYSPPALPIYVITQYEILNN